MTRVALVGNEDVVRVTPQSEHAVPATFKTYTEAIAYCKVKGYEIHDEEKVQSFARQETAIVEELLRSMDRSDELPEEREARLLKESNLLREARLSDDSQKQGEQIPVEDHQGEGDGLLKFVGRMFKKGEPTDG